MKAPVVARRVRVQLIREHAVVSEAVNIGSPRSALAVIGHLALMDREHLVVMHLDARNELIGMETAGIGSLTSALVSPREIYKGAILNNAASIILAHNHPSGTVEPSPDDRVTTKRMLKAGGILGIPLADHIIVAGKGYYSFSEQGQMPRDGSWED